MNRLAIAISLLAVSAASALANPIYNWTGSAATLAKLGPIGKHALAHRCRAIVSAADTRNDMNGVIGGAHLGYNWEYNNKWLLGLEADFQGSDQRGRAGAACAGRRPDIGRRSQQLLLHRPHRRHRTVQCRCISRDQRHQPAAELVRHRSRRVGSTVTPTVLLYASPAAR
jgi:opacity protein-like surface antigen